MSFSATPVVPTDRQLIQGYGNGQFRISGESYEGSVFVHSDHTAPWPVTRIEDVTFETLTANLGGLGDIDILLVGCGPSFNVPSKDLRLALKEQGIVLEWMDTGAACRTFNVLIAEERRVVAALVVVD